MHNEAQAFKDLAEMEATEWRHLLVAGGLWDQPEAAWDDVMTLRGYLALMRIDKERQKNETLGGA